MGASAYVVRAPTIDDAEPLGRVHCAVWQATYLEVMNPKAYAELSPQRFAAGWRRRLVAISDRGESSTSGDNTGPDATGEITAEITRVAEHPHDGIVGFISVGPAREENPPAPQQLWALNLLAAHQGTGLADRLMADVLGDRPAYLWVAQANSRAIRFYHRCGFAQDGGEMTDQRDGIAEIRMVRGG